MNNDMIYRNRYILRLTILLAVLLAGGSAMAGVVVKGSVYGGGNQADVKINSTVNMSAGQVEGNVYGGGNVGDVGNITKNTTDYNYSWKQTDGSTANVAEYNNNATDTNTGICTVTISGGTIGQGTVDEHHGNVFGGGRGEANTFWCEKGIVYATSVSISAGTVNGSVYGGGEVGRVEDDTKVIIGEGTNEPTIKGNVFGAGAGKKTHGYSALVRGNSVVVVQGGAKVEQNVYGGGMVATVGKFWVTGVDYPAALNAPKAPTDLPDGMPYAWRAGGVCRVTVKGSAEITGDVFGAGKGQDPDEFPTHFESMTDPNDPQKTIKVEYYTTKEASEVGDIDTRMPKRMVNYEAYNETTKKGFKDTDKNITWVPYAYDDEDNPTIVWEYFDTPEKYHTFLQTLAIVDKPFIVINESAEVNGSVFGGSESGFVLDETSVSIQGGTIGTTTSGGDVFGGGKGLLSFAEAGRVRKNTKLTITNGAILGNVYGGGSLGDVGTITKPADYNYIWKQNDGTTGNVAEYNVPSSSTHDTDNNTGICTVYISGGTIGAQGKSTENHASGHVFGAGKGSEETWWCEKAIAYATSVTVSAGTVYGNVYGGGQVGRVEDDAMVLIGETGASGDAAPDIKGDVFGAGAGLETHGYSALVRGNALVTVQGTAQVGGSVYGGGEIASVGKFEVVGGLPTKPKDGGTCIVNIKDNAKIGTSGTTHHVFGACKGVTPQYNSSSYKDVYSMQTYENRPEPKATSGDTWDYWETYDPDYEGQKFIKRYYKSEQDYLDFLKTLALTSNPHVTIGGTWTKDGTTETITASGTPSVYGSVYGGGQRGVTLGAVDVNMVGGTVEQDVYGGGALADTNLGNWDVNGYVVATGLTAGTSSVTGLFIKTTVDGKDTYTKITDESATAAEGTTYYRQEATWAHTEGSAYYKTTVDLTGGTIKGDAYGGGLGQKTGFNDAEGIIATKDIEAVVWGDINVNLGSSTSESATHFYITYDTDDNSNSVVKSGRVFGCNNLYGSPRGDVTVTVYRTVNGYNASGETIGKTPSAKKKSETESDHSYELSAVYGGGNLAPYEAANKKTHVVIYGCDLTSILTVYGGGNAAAVTEASVDVWSCYEIGALFGGGNGKDKFKKGTGWETNPGANVNGNTTTYIYGGTVHEAYGASNEKGTITGTVIIDVADSGLKEGDDGYCELDVEKLVGAGKNADVNGDLILVMGCKPSTKIPLVYGGADNANVNGDVELTITSGNFGKVFGGNNDGGIIMGHIKLNIEETGNCGTPITIDELYLGGNQAAYSRYGYYQPEDPTTHQPQVTASGKPVYLPRTAEMYAITDPSTEGYTPAITGEVYGTALRKTIPYDEPVLNVISCTYIGKVFGGGYGTGAALYGNPTVNINMIQGSHAETSVPTKMSELNLPTTENTEHLGIIGDVYGGGNAADVIGNPTVNIGTASTVDLVSTETTGVSVVGAYITGNVYGGGKGEADNFLCDKAMIGKNDDGINNPDGGTTVNIYNGTVRGNVYGGGQIGRVEKNTVVTIGTGDGVATGTPDSAPIIMGSVYGGGAGEEEHGYAALVRGNPTVTIQGNAKVRHSVYGGGEIASVARYKVPKTEKDVEDAKKEGYTEAVLGMPYALKDESSGTCTVTIRGYAEIGPETEMQMTKEGGPDDTGYVFGAGKGILPGGEYEFEQGTTRRMVLYDADVHTTVGQEGSKWQWVDPNHSDTNKNVWEYFEDLDEYIRFIQTLALSSRTEVTITDNAFVKGSVYGGSENGIVQFNTDVKIQGGQIGWGAGETGAHPDAYWTTNSEDPTKFAECPSWTFQSPYAPYDPNATTLYEGKYYYDKNHTQEAAGGASVATDGHTYYGNVFGGGSGSVPYFDHALGRSVYLHSAGQVKGNTNVTISGGHILTNVYGGCESTNVNGTANVTMTAGTVGVPRTDTQIIAHPLTGYIFGGGKGDQRIFFNKDTNVKDAVVTIEGGRVYGSVYGGGEDGHVLRNVTLTIGKQTTTGEGDEAVTTTSGPKIGTKGTSYYDGHVFGGGRGFGGDALTAGNVGGSVDVNILDGEILGSVYGGGRLASVGYGLYLVDDEVNGVKPYGIMRPDDEYDGSYTNPSTEEAEDFFTKGRGHITMTISGGTIGNNDEYAYDANNQLAHTKGGNVFAGGMGRMYVLGSTTTPISSLDWWKLGCVKSTKLTISGDAVIKSCVYGGGELGQVVGAHTAKSAANADVNVGTEVIINDGTIGTEIKDGETVKYTFGSVFGGGYGSLIEELVHDANSNPKKVSYPKYIAGRVKAGTKVNMTNGTVWASVYGGGEMAAVGESVVLGETLTTGFTGDTHVIVSGGTIGKAPITLSGSNRRYFGGAKMGNVYGGGSGHNNTVRSGHIYGNTNVTISGTDTRIYHNVYGGGAYGTVGDFTYSTSLDEQTGTNKVDGISGRHEDHPTSGVARVTITGGTIGYDGKENGMVFGSSRGDINQPKERDDYTAWVYDTHVTIGAPSSQTGPQINGTVYGSGENGHTYNNTVVTVNSGTIGIETGAEITYTENGKSVTKGGADYPYRGNVYGGGCGTDKYYHDPALITGTHTANDGQGDYFNPLAGIVYGTTTVNINGGKVVRNVYGAGAMGSVGKTDWTATTTTTTTDAGEVTTTTKTAATTTGGSTTVNINGGIIGASGTVGDGNVFGAARGSKAIVQTDQDDLSKVSVTNVNVSAGEVKGNVYGGGELGDVGIIDKNAKDKEGQLTYNYKWMKSGGDGTNTGLNNDITGTNTNTGICNVTITGGTIGSTTVGGNVFGGGKGDANTWWCEKAMAFATNVSIRGSQTVVNGTVYGGGEIGRVEDDSKVIIGTENGSDTPDIKGSVFGAGKGMATRGYSALVRGNSVVTIQGSAKVGGNVFGGGEEASLGRFILDKGLPKSPDSGGSATVTIQDNAQIGSSGTDNNVYGAGQGVAPNYDTDPTKYKNYKSMQLEGNKPDGNVGDTWDYYVDDDGNEDRKFVWVYYKTEAAYQSFLNTLAIASHPVVTIAENATVYGDVYGGGQRGITMGSVEVNITGGTVKQDVYGGGSLADTNKGNWDDSRYVEADVTTGASVAGLYTKTGTDYTPMAADATAVDGTTYYRKGYWAEGRSASTYTTTVNLLGGTINRNVYGGGLGNGAVEAMVYGDVKVSLNGLETVDYVTAKHSSLVTDVGGTDGTYYLANGGCVVNGYVFGCNNVNGTPKGHAKVHVFKTVNSTKSSNTPVDQRTTYDVAAVFGGGNAADYVPEKTETRQSTEVIIEGCDLTSIQEVYGGGYGAAVPGTNVLIKGTYIIDNVFGGGYGYSATDNHSDPAAQNYNPGANVGFRTTGEPYGLYLTEPESKIKIVVVEMMAGTVRNIYGGSNTRGDIRNGSSVTTIEKTNEPGNCTELSVQEIYGGGKEAPMDGGAEIILGCMPEDWIGEIYAGAREADVGNDVSLTITSGKFGSVFGGNRDDGTIDGYVEVNIEECPTCGKPGIVIGELYGGGNLAPYTVPQSYETSWQTTHGADSHYPSPRVNVRSFTSIGTIYGGGYGAGAKVTGNPTVNINVGMVQGGGQAYVPENDANKPAGVTLYPHDAGKIGVIGNVFGGGNAAPVEGNTNVYIGTSEYEQLAGVIAGETDVTGYYTRTGAGTTESPYVYSDPIEPISPATSVIAEEGTLYYIKVLGADIKGNVYGGGNAAEVTGNTNVVIGKEPTVTTPANSDP